MGKLIVKLLLAYLIGAMLGASAALIAVEYDLNIGVTLFVAALITCVVDFTLLRAEF